MNISVKSAFALLLALVVVSGLFCLPAAAVGSNISSVEASYSAGTVSVSGTTESGVLAVAVLIYSGDTLLRLETTGVIDETFATAIAITLPAGTYTVKAADYEGGLLAETVFTVALPPSGGVGGSSAPGYIADVPGGSSLPVNVNTAANSVSVNLDTIAKSLTAGSNTVVTMPSIPGVSSYTASLSASSLSGSMTGSLTINTGTGSITIPGNMLSGTGLTGNAEITIGAGDKEGLPDDVRDAIGARPVIRLALAIDGQQTDWSNPVAPVTVSIPYIPTVAELENPESIVVWYIDGSGNVVTIPNGHHDPITGTVTFKTTHFSDYAVAYNKVLFSDVASGAWYFKAVSFIAAREITAGTGDGRYSPDAKLTRAEFIVLMMRAYGIAPDENPIDNFADAGNAYYTGYLAAAKQLGISAGVGNNLFAPGRVITRQEMFTLLYSALKVIDQLPQGDSGKVLSDFIDAGQIDIWAKDAMTLLVETGTVSGNAGKLTPLSTTTRAEMAQVLFNLLGK